MTRRRLQCRDANADRRCRMQEMALPVAPVAGGNTRPDIPKSVRAGRQQDMAVLPQRLHAPYRSALAATLFALILAIGALESVHPLYFSDDDNRDESLPNLTYNYRALQRGELAEYSFQTFAGSPQLASGQSGVLYSLGYLSVWFSTSVLHDIYLSVEVLTILHLLICATGTFLFVYTITGSRTAASLAGLAFPLSNFSLYVGRQWLSVSACAAWFPWMLFFAVRLWRDQIEPRWQVY